MSIPEDVLNSIAENIKKAKETINSVSDVIADLRASGIDASKQETELTAAKSELRRLETFYTRQAGKK